MITTRTLLATSLLLSTTLALRAQPEPPPAPGQIGLSLSSTATASGKAELKAGANTYDHVEIKNYDWKLAQRIPLEDRRSLAVGLDYGVTDIGTRNRHHATATPVPLPSDLQSLGASLRYTHPLDPQWILTGSVSAGSHVAETGLLSDGWGAGASVIALYNQSRELTLVFGVVYNSLSENFKVIPIFGLNWRPADKWSVNLGLPKTGVTYKLNEKISLDLSVSGERGSYAVNDDPLPGAAPRSLADSRLQYLEARLGFSCDWKINDTFRVSGTAGQVLYRQFKYIDRDYTLTSRDLVPFVTLSARISL